MKRYEISWKSLRAAGFCLLAAGALAACDSEEFVRDAGTMPASPDGTPVGALYAEGGFVSDAQDFSISENTNASVVYRLNIPAAADVTVTLAVGTQEDVDAYNDAKGLQDNDGNLGGFKRYRLLPGTNYTLPETMTLTVPKGKTESAPLAIGLIYDKTLLPTQMGFRMKYPWMLPLQVKSIQGEIMPVTVDQVFGVGVRPANLPGTTDMMGSEIVEWKYPEDKEEPIMFIAFADCRVIDPSYAIYYGYQKAEYEYIDFGGWGFYQAKEGSTSYYPLFDVECLRPAFITYDAETKRAMLKPDPDLMYPLTHQGRYLDPARNRHIKLCVSVETEAKSVVGLCNLDDETRASLVWQISDFVKKYNLDGVSLNDKGANYAAEGAPAVDKASYTKFLKALREALGSDKLILVSYDADENSALYEEHDGLRAGDYIDFAWWGTENKLCTPYAAVPTVKPIAGLAKSKFAPIAGNAVDTPEYQEFWQTFDEMTFESLALIALRDLYDKGECPVCVFLGILPRIQGFNENNQFVIPVAFGSIPLHESDMNTKPGWASQGFLTMETVTPPWLDGGGAYGAGLKDW